MAVLAMQDAIRRRVLQRALEIVGGRSVLLARLGVAEHTLEFWLSGRALIPDRAFYVLVDIVLEEGVARAAQDRRTQPRAPLAGADLENEPLASRRG
jgi:hypothetical protein